jgi:hypothetical protein
MSEEILAEFLGYHGWHKVLRRNCFGNRCVYYGYPDWLPIRFGSLQQAYWYALQKAFSSAVMRAAMAKVHLGLFR